MQRKQDQINAELRAEIAALRLREAERDVRINCLERALGEGCEDLPERPPGVWLPEKQVVHLVSRSGAWLRKWCEPAGGIRKIEEGARVYFELESTLRERANVRPRRTHEDVPMLPHEQHDRPWTAAAPRPHRRA